MHFHISSELLRSVDVQYDWYQRNSITTLIRYIVDSKVRRSVILGPWLEAQVGAAYEIDELRLAAESCVGVNNDLTMRNILRYVCDNFRYITDKARFGSMERWEDIGVVWDAKKGDCESQALVIYCMAFLAGVPFERLFIFAGDVHDPFNNRVAGHAWVSYIPEQYPLSFAFMDSTYYPTLNSMNLRPKFLVKGNQIHGDVNEYKNIWFALQAGKSYLNLYNRAPPVIRVG